jgi:hypothetical protein
MAGRNSGSSRHFENHFTRQVSVFGLNRLQKWDHMTVVDWSHSVDDVKSRTNVNGSHRNTLMRSALIIVPSCRCTSGSSLCGSTLRPSQAESPICDGKSTERAIGTPA